MHQQVVLQLPGRQSHSVRFIPQIRVYVAGDVSRDVQLAIIAAAEGARAGLAINKDLLAPL